MQNAPIVKLSEADETRFKSIQKQMVDAAGDRFRSSVKSIYAVKENGRPTHLGSATLLKIGSDHVLLTAAHVIDKNEVSTLYVAAGLELVSLAGEFFISRKRRGRDLDHFDIAFTKLNPEMVDRFGDSFIPEARISAGIQHQPGRLFTALGYPNSLNKNFDNRKLAVKAQDFSFTSVHRELPWLSKRMTGKGEYHLQMMYDRRARTETGEIDNAIFPRGMSGGPMIDVGRPAQVFLGREARPEPTVAAMTIELKHRRLIGIRLDLIMPNIKAELGISG